MNEWETCIAEWSIRCRELQLERDALKLEVYEQRKLAEKYWKEAREAVTELEREITRLQAGLKAEHARSVQLVQHEIIRLTECITEDKRRGYEEGAMIHVYALAQFKAVLNALQRGRGGKGCEAPFGAKSKNEPKNEPNNPK